MLLSIVLGTFGELYAPGRIINPNNAAATAQHVVSSSLLRWGFAAYWVEAVCDLALSVLFYALLQPVSRTLALYAAVLGIASTIMYAVSEAFYFAPTLVLGGANYTRAFTPDQLDAIVMLSFRFFQRIAGLFIGLYGLASVIRGWLIFRSGYLPRLLGVLLILGGSGFVLQNSAIVVAPRLASPILLMPMGLAGIALMMWLFIRGVDAVGFDAWFDCDADATS